MHRELQSLRLIAHALIAFLTSMLIKIVILKEMFSLRIEKFSSKYIYIKLCYYTLFENWLIKYLLRQE